MIKIATSEEIEANGMIKGILLSFTFLVMALAVLGAVVATTLYVQENEASEKCIQKISEQICLRLDSLSITERGTFIQTDTVTCVDKENQVRHVGLTDKEIHSCR